MKCEHSPDMMIATLTNGHCPLCLKEEVKALKKKLRTKPFERISDAIACPDDECCGCLIEVDTFGDISCNECGKKFELKALKGG